MPKTIVYIIFILALNACSEGSLALEIFDEEENISDIALSAPNIMLIIGDDIGLDALYGYEEGTIKANTPNLEKLMDNGLRFNNFWTNSVCSPTRATILTGKYGYRTGVRQASDQISTSEETLQAYINQKTNNAYATAVIGKWHLFGSRSTTNPEIMGIDYFAGIIGGGVQDYYSWPLFEDGVSSTQTDYSTTKLTDLAIDWLAVQSQPWFLWLAYNAPHTPFHLPPSEMISQGNLSGNQSDINANPLPYYLAAIEAIDFQIGRLLESMTQNQIENTAIIFIGDNGTPGQVAQSPYSQSKAKGSLYQGGVNNPMIMSGANITRRGEVGAMINSTDLFATIASLAGAEVDEIGDSRDFSSLLIQDSDEFRQFTYAEYQDEQTDEWCIRNETHKLIVSDSVEELYDLDSDPYEDNNLMGNDLQSADQVAKEELLKLLSEIRK